MRERFRFARMASACAGLAVAATIAATPSGASAGPSLHIVPVHPSARAHGGASPFKVERSAAHGIVYRGGPAAPKAALRFASPAEECKTACAGPLLYHKNGVVMHRVKKYVIQWEPVNSSSNGQTGTSFQPLPSPFRSEISEFLQNVAADSVGSKFSNAYSVDSLYGEPEIGRSGEYNSEFGQSFLDTTQFPVREAIACPTSTEPNLPPATQPCISDSEEHPQLAEEVVKFVVNHGLPTGLGAIYFIVTPNEVNSCAGTSEGTPVCNTNFYCAYHSAAEFESAGTKHIVVYANMPYADRPGCETPDQPHGSPADDEIDVIGHEDNEAITDPLGNAWFDIGGNEVADKCTYPFFDPLIDFNPAADAYGDLLGGVPATYGPEGNVVAVGSAYNQAINSNHYLLQREWSNAAGGCVAQAPVPVASFTVYTSPGTVGSAISFNGSSSSPTGGSITGYKWEFGDGGSASGAEVVHTYQSTGQFPVRLTVSNDSGASAAAFGTVVVNSQPAPTPPAPIVLTKTVAVSTPAEPVAYSATQLAQKLGLPVSGAKLSGLGAISLGKAECPPACKVTVRVYARIGTTVHGHRSVKKALIGTAVTTFAAKQGTALLLRLNSVGRKLLHRLRTLEAMLSVTVVGQEGGSWQIVRTVVILKK